MQIVMRMGNFGSMLVVRSTSSCVSMGLTMLPTDVLSPLPDDDDRDAEGEPE